MKQSAKNYKRIVVKIGSSLFYSAQNQLDFGVVEDLVAEISGLVKEKTEVVVVSSGAIALGMSLLNLRSRPKELAYLQAAAAVGQNELMDIYRRLFKEKQLGCAQVLLTREDLNERSRYLNAKNTLFALLKLGSVPVINENDTVATEEIRFGDNDQLSALVATLVACDLLIILSDVDGLLAKDKKTVVKVIDRITPSVKALATTTGRNTSVGGMITKIEAAKVAVDSGIACVIANGRHKGVISSTVKEPGSLGTLFLPQGSCLAAKKRWIAFGTQPKGKIIVDDGAKKALLNKKSLLSVGITALEGGFECGDVVTITGQDNCEFARGKVCLSSKHLDKVKGRRSDKEVVHCDNIVVLSE